jgi:hypothetical protein
MADQPIKITSMPDNSAARVALELFHDLRNIAGLYDEPRGDATVTKSLDLYARCLNAARGYDHGK